MPLTRNNDDGSLQRHDSVLGRVARAIVKGWNDVIECESQKIKKDSALHNRGGAALLHEVLWFGSVSRWIVDGHFQLQLQTSTRGLMRRTWLHKNDSFA